MEAREKALELVGKMCLNDCTDKNIKLAKQFALIAVEENLEYEKILVEQIKNHVEVFKGMKFKTQNLFWETVKQEIEKL